MGQRLRQREKRDKGGVYEREMTSGGGWRLAANSLVKEGMRGMEGRWQGGTEKAFVPFICLNELVGTAREPLMSVPSLVCQGT